MGIIKDDMLAHARQALEVTTVPGKGRGVRALRRIRAGEVLERSPVLVVPRAEVSHVERTVLEHYVYDWADDALAVALGHGSLFNHSYAPNARYVKLIEAGVIEYVALVDIEAGAEVTINYNGAPTDRAPLWFTVV